MGQLWGQHLNIEKHRVFVNKPFSLLFDSRRPWILYECLLCAKSERSTFEILIHDLQKYSKKYYVEDIQATSSIVNSLNQTRSDKKTCQTWYSKDKYNSKQNYKNY